MGNNKSATTKNAGESLTISIAIRMRRYDAGEHIHGFTWSHWTPPLGKCLRRIAPAAVMVDKFVETTLNTNKTNFLPSNYGTLRALVVCENFVPQIGPSTQLIDATSCIKLWNTTIVAEELTNISSYQMLWGDKNCIVIKQSRSLINKLAHILLSIA